MSKNMRLHNRIADGLRRGVRTARMRAHSLPASWWKDYREYPDPVACKTKPEPGTSVRLHGQYLRNTGQELGGEGRRIWQVQACACALCDHGRHVAVDQVAVGGGLGAGPGLGPWRHIAWANLQDVDAWLQCPRGYAAEQQRRRERFEAGM